MADGRDWANITREVGFGSHTDRIILLLGPEEIPYELPLSDIPKNAGLLNQIGRLPTKDRSIRLPTLDIDVIKAYIDMNAYIYDRNAATERSWVDMIKLAITAEVLQDSAMRISTFVALREKAKHTSDSREQVLLEAGYEKTRDYNAATGGGVQLLEILDSIKQGPWVRSDQDREVEANKAGAGDFEEPKYVNSALRKKTVATTEAEEDEKWYPVRQPTVPPSVEEVRDGTKGNFER
jgi:hypothetical protein